eukprot:9092211-Pyramimonas_sp.AAC.1
MRARLAPLPSADRNSTWDGRIPVSMMYTCTPVPSCAWGPIAGDKRAYSRGWNQSHGAEGAGGQPARKGVASCVLREGGLLRFHGSSRASNGKGAHDTSESLFRERV